MNARTFVLIAIAGFLCSCASTAPPVRKSAERELIAWLGDSTNLMTSIEQLPPEVRKRYGHIADRGEKFNWSDYIEPGLPVTRFIVAGRKQDTLRVATERGGFAPRSQIDAFLLDPSDKILSLRKNISGR
jgi:hypothetical protein